MKKAFNLVAVGVVFILIMANTSKGATNYPTKIITLINPSAPGGTADILSRNFIIVAEKILGKTIVLVNKPGAGNMIGSTAGAQAAPDGYTLCVISSALTNGVEWEIVNGRKPPFTRHDFIPLGVLTQTVPLVVVAYDSPWKTLSDLISACKAKPNQYAFASGGLYGGSHLPAEVLVKAAGIKCRHVPFDGGAAALAAVIGKHVEFATQFATTSLPLMRGNKLRTLAVQSDQRLKALPDIPTVKELGIDADYRSWMGFGVPKNTPMDIVEKLRDVVTKVSKDKSFIDKMESMGEEVRYMSGEETVKYWDTSSVKVAAVLRELLEASKK
jgi:tripartite-type tricarboxylate transporter receptor subunit TctC